MRLTLRALVVAAAAASSALAVTAYAPSASAQSAICVDEIKLEEKRINDLGDFISSEKHIQDRLLKNAANREADATVKDNQAAKFNAAAAKATDPAKKKALLDFAAFLTAAANTDRAVAKERKTWAASVGTGIAAAEADLAAHVQYLARLKSSCS